MKNKNKIAGLAILLILIACLSCLAFTTQTKAQDKTISIDGDFSIVKGQTGEFNLCLGDKSKNTDIEISMGDSGIAKIIIVGSQYSGSVSGKTKSDGCIFFIVKGLKLGTTQITVKSAGYTSKTKFIGVQEKPFNLVVTPQQDTEQPPSKVDFITSIQGGIPPYTCLFSSGERGFFVTQKRVYTKKGIYTEALYYAKPSNVVPYTATISCTDDFGQRIVKDISITVEALVKKEPEKVVITQKTLTETCKITGVKTFSGETIVSVRLFDISKQGTIFCSVGEDVGEESKSKRASIGDSNVEVKISKTWAKEDIGKEKKVSCVIWIDGSSVSRCDDRFTVTKGVITSTTDKSDLTEIKDDLNLLKGAVKGQKFRILTLKERAIKLEVAGKVDSAQLGNLMSQLTNFEKVSITIEDSYPQITAWINSQSSSTAAGPTANVIAIIGHAITGYGTEDGEGTDEKDTESGKEAGGVTCADLEGEWVLESQCNDPNILGMQYDPFGGKRITDYKSGYVCCKKIKEAETPDSAEGEESTPTEESVPVAEEGATIDEMKKLFIELIGLVTGQTKKLDKFEEDITALEAGGETPDIKGKDGEKESELAKEKNKLLKGLWNFTRIKGGPWQKGYLIGTWIYSTLQAGSYTRGAGTCFAEQPLPGTEYCEACNMPFAACSEKRCGILGSCKWVEVDDGRGGVCMPGVCEPTSVPVIMDMDVRFYIDNTKSWRNFTKIKPPCPSAPPAAKGSAACIKVGELVPYNASDIEIDISLNQHARCRYIIDKHNASFEEMNDFKGNQFYPLVQSAVLDITNLELGENHSIYIKCEGSCGQTHAPGFDWNFIKFKFEEKPDELPPVIVKLVPDPTSQYISSESTEETIEIWLDEAGFCKYSHIGTNDICGNNLTTNWTSGGMCPVHNTLVHNVKSFTCSKNREQCCLSSGIGSEPTCYEKYDCGRCNLTIDPTTGYEELNWSQLGESAELPELVNQIPSGTLDYMKSLGMTGIGKVFTYMFRCSDGTNIMHEENSYMYVIMTYPPFEMNITEPEDSSISYERVWNISVNTSRPTECRYTANTSSVWQKWEYMEEINDGFRTEHKGLTSELLPAHYTMNVRCRDSGGLEEQGSVEFTVLKDTTEPMVIRLYNWEDYLYIETDEKTDCVYGIVDCNYDFDDGMEMVGAMQYIHSAPWSLDNNYYVKCKDRWDNKPLANKCTAIISPYEVPEL